MMVPEKPSGSISTLYLDLSGKREIKKQCEPGGGVEEKREKNGESSPRSRYHSRRINKKVKKRNQEGEGKDILAGGMGEGEVVFFKGLVRVINYTTVHSSELFPLPTSHFPLHTSHFPLPTSHFPLHTSHFTLQPVTQSQSYQ
jgi:hypothetical protein